MNIIKREWHSYRKHTIYWSIGILLLIVVAFYKVSGMNPTPGGVEAMLNSLPPIIQVFFGAGAVDYTSAVGNYSMIHLYLVIALSLHAVIIGASIFAKEEQDKTYEFLYVKGVKRWNILIMKIVAGTSILLVMDILCLVSVIVSVLMMNLTFVLSDLLPFMLSLFITQFFFFSLALFLSLILKNSQKAGMFACCIVFAMFLISMYVKLGGNVEFLDTISLFHYSDTSYIQAHQYGGISSIVIVFLTMSTFVASGIVHEHRDLL